MIFNKFLCQLAGRFHLDKAAPAAILFPTAKRPPTEFFEKLLSQSLGVASPYIS